MSEFTSEPLHPDRLYNGPLRRTRWTFTGTESDGEDCNIPAESLHLYPADKWSIAHWFEKLEGEHRDRNLGHIELVNFPDHYKLFISVRHGPGPEFKATGGVDMYLYGHPTGRFRSPKEFFPHLLAIMKGELDTCTCVRCKAKGKES